MGVNFNAMFTHSYNFNEIKAIPDTINNNGQMVYLNNIVYENSHSKWELPEAYSELDFNIGGFVTVIGPNFLELTFGQYLCSLHHVIRWSTFISNKEAQMWLRNICYELSSVLGNPMYIPDNYDDCLTFVLEEGNHQDVNRFLQKNFGSPNKTIESLNEKNEDLGFNGYQGYYIDTFADLKKE
ncbi:hypothetical protein VQL36_04785 [Chengkuizengella sp. SCS-71B]|uniref:hypothetical protein n=1 Tax=Chengkuizengella sp. SCS-71B TaxID=3115290 RepID=UPI0032C24A72